MSDNQQAASVICLFVMFGCFILAFSLPDGLLTEISLQIGAFMLILLSLIGPSKNEKTRRDLLSGMPFWIGVFFWIFGYPYGETLLVIGLILTGLFIAYFKLK